MPISPPTLGIPAAGPPSTSAQNHPRNPTCGYILERPRVFSAAVSAVNRGHVIGVFAGALVAALVIYGFLSLISEIYGYGWLGPFHGSADAFGFHGSTGHLVLLLLDLVIPLIAASIFLVALVVLSRTEIRILGFESRRQVLLDGLLLGLAVWILLYVPFTVQSSHLGLDQAVVPLGLGLMDHLAFGLAISLVMFRIGGPVHFGRLSPDGARPTGGQQHPDLATGR